MSTTQYQVLVRNGSSDLLVAAVLGMSDCVGEGRTREEAIAKAKAALVDRLARGEIVIPMPDRDRMQRHGVGGKHAKAGR